MGPNAPISANSSYLRNSISAHSDGSSDQDKVSIVTQGGTDQIISLNTISKNTKSLISSLATYVDTVRGESTSETQWPRIITSGLTMAEYTVRSLQRHSAQLSRHDPDGLVDVVRGIDFNRFPTYVSLFNANPDQHRDRENDTGNLDIPAMLLEQAKALQEEIVKAWEVNVKCGRERVSPAKFGNRGQWHRMQTEHDALLCHRPASNRPHRPLEIMHVAFYEFVKKAELNIGELADFHVATEALCRYLTDPLRKEKDRANFVLEELKKVFPNNTQFEWLATREYLIYQRILTSEYHPRFPKEEKHHVTNLIIVKVKLEDGENGDAFMHLSRYYGNIVEGNPKYCETGAPMFLITISGVCT